MRSSEILFSASALFLLGIAAAGVGLSGWSILTITAVVSGGFLLFSIKNKNKKFKLWSFLVWMIFAGCFYLHFRESLTSNKIPLSRKIAFVAVVADYPELNDKSQVLKLRLQSPWSGEITSYNRVYPEYDYGDSLRVTGLIQKNNAGYSTSFPETALIRKDQGLFPYTLLFNIKTALTNSLRKALPISKAGFAVAMLFGDESLLQKEFIEALRKTGTSHLVALSGYNILIIVNAVQIFLGAFGLRRRSFLIVILFIAGFILMTGAAASVVRAGIMAILMIIARNNSRFYSAKNPIAFTAFIMVLINPRFLIFDLGFQLSFLALIGIVYLAPLIKQKLKIEDKGFLGWKESFIQTLSAQIMVAPLLFLKMGSFSFLSVVPNILILEAVPLIMFGGFLTAVLGLISKPFAVIVGWPLGLLLAYAQGIINYFSRFM